MSDFFVFLETHRVGILMAILCSVVLMAIVQWIAWLFSLGRFGKQEYWEQLGKRTTLFHTVFGNFIAKIIYEFGHLIALIILFIFAFTLIFTMIQTRGNPAEMRDSLQTIVSSLGGLVGTVIGYYFNAVKNLGSSAQSEERKTTPVDVGTRPQSLEGESHHE
jgi:hypothetical protein